MDTISTGPVAARITPDLLDLVGGIYQAELEPEIWPVVLGRIRQFFQADWRDNSVGQIDTGLRPLPLPSLDFVLDAYAGLEATPPEPSFLGRGLKA